MVPYLEYDWQLYDLRRDHFSAFYVEHSFECSRRIISRLKTQTHLWKQCCGTLKICCGSGSDFEKVMVPVLVPDLDNILHSFPTTKKLCLSMSEAALFPRKMAFHFRFFDFFYSILCWIRIRCRNRIRNRNRDSSGSGSTKANSYGSCDSGSKTLSESLLYS